AKNIRKSTLQNQDFYFIINPSAGPLEPNNGLYVQTCSMTLKYYYAVMVVDLSTGIEDDTVIFASNSISTGIKEHLGNPQPVVQNTVTQSNGDINYECVIWGGNQDVPGYSAVNNCGSFGYNFTFIS